MYFAFDIGGTKTRIVGSKNLTEFIDEPIKIDTPHSFDEFVEIFCSTVQNMAGNEPIEAIGGGITGVLNKEKTAILHTRLTDFEGRRIPEILGERLQTNVFMNNDTAIVGLGEVHAGAGKNQGDIVVYITVSTGVGGVRIIGGKLAQTTYNFEIGHHFIDVDHTMCPDSVDGTLEGMVSGTATEKRFGKKAYEVTDVSLWNEQLPQWLSYGLHNVTVFWSPDAIVLGGSMIIGEPAISVEATAQKLTTLVARVYPETPNVVKATLGDFGGLHGGFAYIKQHLT